LSESSSNLTSLLSEVAKKTAQYAWLEAVGLYEKALAVTGEMLEKARIASEIGRSYFQSAFQSDSRGEFKELIVKAKSALRFRKLTLRLRSKIRTCQREDLVRVFVGG